MLGWLLGWGWGWDKIKLKQIWNQNSKALFSFKNSLTCLFFLNFGSTTLLRKQFESHTKYEGDISFICILGYSAALGQHFLYIDFVISNFLWYYINYNWWILRVLTIVTGYTYTYQVFGMNWLTMDKNPPPKKKLWYSSFYLWNRIYIFYHIW